MNLDPDGWTVDALAQACVRQPLSQPVPANDAAFLASKGRLKLAVRTARRRVLLRLSGQRPLLRSRLDPAWRRGLWVHEGMPQIGDAMMDLAPRSLLAAAGLAVDLFAAPHIASLLEGDPWFANVLSQGAQVHAGSYDFVIALSDDRKSLRLKRERLALLPWVSLQGCYGGPDFHRARFAARRLADLMGLALSDDALAAAAAQKLGTDATTSAWAAAQVGGRPSIAFALGGVHGERTYHRWPEVLERLIGHGLQQLLLVGDRNGRALADAVVAAICGRVPVLDFVGRTSLREVHALLDQAGAAVCADGGLMHIALATPSYVVALFGAQIAPQWRLPLHGHCVGLASPTSSVDGIAPQDIADALLQWQAHAAAP